MRTQANPAVSTHGCEAKSLVAPPFQDWPVRSFSSTQALAAVPRRSTRRARDRLSGGERDETYSASTSHQSAPSRDVRDKLLGSATRLRGLSSRMSAVLTSWTKSGLLNTVFVDNGSLTTAAGGAFVETSS